MNLQPGPVRVDCPCDCGAFGVLRKNGHVRKCPCRKCLGGRNRDSGLKKQRQARKRAGIPKAKFHGFGGNEENWQGPLRVEVKSGAQIKPVATAYLRAEAQSDAAKAEGDARGMALIAMPGGWGSEGLVVMRLSEWEREIVPRLEA